MIKINSNLHRLLLNTVPVHVHCLSDKFSHSLPEQYDLFHFLIPSFWDRVTNTVIQGYIVVFKICCALHSYWLIKKTFSMFC